MTPTNVFKASIKVCMFDQYGTIVDMQAGLTELVWCLTQRDAEGMHR
jgi:hypothetical protein